MTTDRLCGKRNIHRYPFLVCPLGDSGLNFRKPFLPDMLYQEFLPIQLGRLIVLEDTRADQFERYVFQLERKR